MRNKRDIPKELAAVLAHTGWLAHTPSEFSRQFLDLCEFRTANEGETLVRAGDPPLGLIGVGEGALGIEITMLDTGPRTAHVAHAGFWFGELTVLRGLPHRVTATAVVSTSVAVVRLDSINRLLSQRPDFWKWIGVLASLNGALALAATEDSMIRGTESRIVAILLRLSGGRAPDNLGLLSSEIYATQEQIAEIANVSRTTAGAVLRQLEDEGLVRCGYRQISILDGRALERRVR